MSAAQCNAKVVDGPWPILVLLPAHADVEDAFHEILCQPAQRVQIHLQTLMLLGVRNHHELSHSFADQQQHCPLQWLHGRVNPLMLTVSACMGIHDLPACCPQMPQEILSQCKDARPMAAHGLQGHIA